MASEHPPLQLSAENQNLKIKSKSTGSMYSKITYAALYETNKLRTPVSRQLRIRSFRRRQRNIAESHAIFTLFYTYLYRLIHVILRCSEVP